MAANPPLYEALGAGGAVSLLPVPFAGERVLLRRDAMGLELRGELQDARGRARAWATSGSLVLTDVRLVFVAGKASREGLRAFDFPLQYVRGERFNQPIFGANNLSGECFRVESGGSGRPLAFKFKFNSGGAGTFLPLFWGLMAYVRERAGSGSVSQAPQAPQAPQAAPQRAPAAATAAVAAGAGVAPQPDELLQTAFVDPNDPSTVYVVEPDPPPPGTAQPEAGPAWILPRPPSNGATFAPTPFQR